MVKKSEETIPNELLRHARELRNWTQAQVEEQLEVGEGLVSSWERGIKRPGAVNRRKLCKLYGATPVELGLIEERLPPPRVKRPLHPQEQPVPSIWMVPYESHPMFTGRDQLLEQLHTALLVNPSTSFTRTLSGLGGVGKTQLAVEYCHRYRSDYKAVFWIPADSPDTILESLTTMAKILRWPRKIAGDYPALCKTLHEWMRAYAHWLLVLDNVEDLNTVNDLLPSARRGHVLITTRAQTLGKYPKIEVQDLPIDDGALFLLRKAHLVAPDVSLHQAEDADREDARQIARTLGGLPLALEQAGAYIGETGCDISQYLARYQARRATLLRERGRMARQDLHPESVTVTFLLSLAKIEHANPAAADLLRLCSFLAPDAIPEDLFARSSPTFPPALRSLIADPTGFDKAIMLIRDYSLLQRLARRQAFGIHRVVQAVIQDDLEEQASVQSGKQTPSWRWYISLLLPIRRPSSRTMSPICLMRWRWQRSCINARW